METLTQTPTSVTPALSLSNGSVTSATSDTSTKPPLWKQLVGMVMGMVVALTLYNIYKDGSAVVSAYLIKSPEEKTEIVIEKKAVQATQKQKRGSAVQLQPLL